MAGSSGRLGLGVPAQSGLTAPASAGQGNKTGDFPKARQFAEQALEVACRLGDDRLLINAMADQLHPA